MHKYIILNEDNMVVSIRWANEIVEGEIQSDIGELGQIMQPDGSFITPEPEPVVPMPTLEDKVNYLYYKSKGVI